MRVEGRAPPPPAVVRSFHSTIDTAMSLPGKYRLLLCLCASLAILPAPPAAAAAANRVMMPAARFATGDDPRWRLPDFDDSAWAVIDTSNPYEQQGYDGYDGYSWYRIHVVIPTSLKAASDWPERLRVFLSGIDDADETYLNGHLIGKTGRMSVDPGGFDSRWQVSREYLADLTRVPVRWDQDNVVAVRVYDAVASGGFYKKDVPYLTVPNRVDGLRFDAGAARYDFLPDGRVTTTLTIANGYTTAQRGRFHVDVVDNRTGKVVHTEEAGLDIPAEQSRALTWVLPSRPGMEARYRFIDAASGRSASAVHALPYLLTPPDRPRPAIHGARLLGARPGTPLSYRIPATGKPPLRFAAEGLPPELTLDPNTGVISGTVPAAGAHAVNLVVSNALGKARRRWTLVAGDALALTPPMGWNSWNVFGVNVSDDKVRQTARVLVDSGLAAKGWNSLNIDDGWQAAARAADGEIAGNERFPDMASLGNYLHGQGLRLGIYSSPGPATCGKYLGSYGHEAQDAATYAKWGVDFLKYDLCSYEDMISQPATREAHIQPYKLMGDALRAQRRGITYSLCQYGKQEVWTWGGDVGGHAWRMTGDIFDTWESVLETGFASAPYARFVRPGRWNDPDMLVVGYVGWGDPRPSRLTPDEQYSHISLWSLLAAPLLLGNDLSRLDAFTLNLLTNSEVLAINQDALGRAAERVLDANDWQIWVKPLEDGSKVIGVFNMGGSFRSIDLDPAQYAKGKAGLPYNARDAWRQSALKQKSGKTRLSIPAHGVVLLTVR